MADTPLAGLPKVRQAMDYFRGQGWSPAQTAGIVSNLWHESGLDETNNTGDNGSAYGIGQWHAPRQEQFQEFNGNPIKGSSFQDQLGFVQHELTEGADPGARRAGKALQNAQNPADAAAIVMKGFERPSDPMGYKVLNRGTTAEDLFDALQDPE